MKWFNKFAMWGESVEVDSPEEMAEAICEMFPDVYQYREHDAIGLVRVVRTSGTRSEEEAAWETGLAGIEDEDGDIAWDDFVDHVASGLRYEPSKRFYARDDGGEEIDIGEHDSLAEACEHARLEWETCGCYDESPRCLINIEVWAEDAPHEGRSIEIEVGEDEPPPETLCGETDEDHDWRKPYHLLGGCTGNPGVWSVNNRIRETEVCARCGLYRRWTSASIPGQFPHEPERVEYDAPTEESLIWAARETWLVTRRWKLASIEARDNYLEIEYRMRTGSGRDDYVRIELEARYADSGPIRPCVRDDHEPLEAFDRDELCEFIVELPDFPNLVDWFEPHNPGRLRLCEDVCQKAAQGMTMPPEDGGQMVQASYGYDHRGRFYMCEMDRSARSEAWYYANAEDCGCEGECDCFSPHICTPEGFDWVRAIPHYKEFK